MSWISEHAEALGFKPKKCEDIAKHVSEGNIHLILDDPEEQVFCPNEICKDTKYVTSKQLGLFYIDKIKYLEEQMGELADEIQEFDPDKIYDAELEQNYEYYTDEIERLKEELNEILEKKQDGLIDISKADELIEELNDEINSNEGALEYGEIDISEYLDKQQERESELSNLIELSCEIVSDYMYFLIQNSALEIDVDCFLDDYYELLEDAYENYHAIEPIYESCFNKMLDDISSYTDNAPY